MKSDYRDMLDKIQKYIKRFRAFDRVNRQPLTPKNDVDISMYEQDLDIALLAETGSRTAFFGSDKYEVSSVIRTYEERHYNIKFLHISLAQYKSNTECENDSLEIKESILEGKVINQLIQQIDPRKIPLTKFKIKRQTSKYRTAINVGLLIILLITCLHIIKFSTWRDYVNSIQAQWFSSIKQILLVTTHNEVQIISGIICLGVLAIVLYRIISYAQYQNIIKKVSLQGNEIELFLESEESYFDKYLNDVIYLFDKVDADVIVFDNITKYITNQIFQRLKDINELVNKRRKTPLRFLYLLPDYLLTSKERNDFFNHRLSLIKSHNYNSVVDCFKKAGILKHFNNNEDYIRNLAPYITDIHVMTSACNEFSNYPSLRVKADTNYIKLISAMVYKNQFPNDYCCYREDKGFLYLLFSRKNEFLQSSLSDISKQIEAVSSEIADLEDEPLKSEAEIEILYDHLFMQCQENSSPEEKEYRIKELRKEKERRLNIIRNRRKRTKRKLEKMKRLLICEKERLHDKTRLCEILADQNIDEVFVRILKEMTEETDIKNREHAKYGLLKYFLSNGYIDETLEEYMYCE